MQIREIDTKLDFCSVIVWKCNGLNCYEFLLFRSRTSETTSFKKVENLLYTLDGALSIVIS